MHNGNPSAVKRMLMLFELLAGYVAISPRVRGFPPHQQQYNQKTSRLPGVAH